MLRVSRNHEGNNKKQTTIITKKEGRNKQGTKNRQDKENKQQDKRLKMNHIDNQSKCK